MIFEPFDFSKSPLVRTPQQNLEALLDFFIFVIYEGELELKHGFYSLFYFLDPMHHSANKLGGVLENLQVFSLLSLFGGRVASFTMVSYEK